MSFTERYTSVRNHTMAICEPLNIEDHGMQPFDFTSPAKWHLAHTTWFFEAMVLQPHFKDYKIFDQKFSYYFNSYYNSLGERQQRDRRCWLTRPYLEEIHAYRTYVDEAMMKLALQDPSEEVRAIIEVGLHHEQQHQELLWTDLKLGLGVQPFDPVYHNKPMINDGNIHQSESREWIEMPSGRYQIGADGKGFSFDNEHGVHEVLLPDFKIASTPVTTGEYIEFIESGGYEEFDHWHDEALSWKEQERVELPLYWRKTGSGYSQFTLAGLQPIRGNEVLQHVNYYEAVAFANWKGLRLPTEFEWEVAQSEFHWGEVWEWTQSAYLPYPGYRKPTGAVGEYNGKFMVGQMVLRGGSIATSPNHTRPTYRNFFHPKMNWQFSGIRLAADK